MSGNNTITNNTIIEGTVTVETARRVFTYLQDHLDSGHGDDSNERTFGNFFGSAPYVLTTLSNGEYGCCDAEFARFVESGSVKDNALRNFSDLIANTGGACWKISKQAKYSPWSVKLMSILYGLVTINFKNWNRIRHGGTPVPPGTVIQWKASFGDIKARVRKAISRGWFQPPLLPPPPPPPPTLQIQSNTPPTPSI